MRLFSEVFEKSVMITPIWNVRTNRFHRKCGYKQTGKDIESAYYEKCKNEDSCGYPLRRNVKIHIK